MAEYYPLLAKAIGSLPNATPDKRQVVYDRARKALIGQLRTLHPPVPDEDIEHESNELDRAVERLEGELASRPMAVADAGPSAVEARAVSAPVSGPARSPLPAGALAGSSGGELGRVERRPLPPLRTKAPLARPTPATQPSAAPVADVRQPDEPAVPRTPVPDKVFSDEPVGTGAGDRSRLMIADLPAGPTVSGAAQSVETGLPGTEGTKGFKLPGGRGAAPRADGRRPVAPQPPSATGARRPLWIIPAGIGVVLLLVGIAAYKLRDRPQATVHATPSEQQAQSDSGKIAERVGGPVPSDAAATRSGSDQGSTNPSGSPSAANPASSNQASSNQASSNQASTDQPAVAPANPELPVAHRAALLVEAPDEANKVKTFLGTTVWKLNNVSGGPNDPVGLAVEADVDLPDDKMKAVVTFEKNTDASLPASHTIKVRFIVQPGSPTGDIKQISVPQLRREDSPTGEGLAGVTVSVIPNSFLVGLSPGAAEANNLELMRSLQWIDIPMLLASGRIAKLTFEKSDSGQRDLNEAVAAWQK